MTALRSSAHRRHNPLLDEWVLCSPDRLERPWQGRVEPVAPEPVAFDPACYLCPGNQRASGAVNPDYKGPFAFDNDFPSLRSESNGLSRDDDLLRAAPERGSCRVLCFTERHDLALATMPAAAIRGVVDAWADESERAAAHEYVAYVQLFENKGLMMGCSNPHPHAQIWATEHVPTLPARKRNTQRAYHARHRRDMLGDYLAAESRERERVVWANEYWTVLVPFWAVWPYQTMLVPTRRVTALAHLEPSERDALAGALAYITQRYDALFGTSTPYSMAWSAAPTSRAEADEGSWRLHGELLPPLLRSATVRKFLVGYEMLATPQRDITPEAAAQRLREV
jgi:UDPglucose--hexose-1-phosphate uridylyltransferase